MAITNIKQVKQNTGQRISSDGVITRIGNLENENIKSVLLSVCGKSENICFYGLDIGFTSGLTVYVEQGSLAQYVDDYEMNLGILASDSSGIPLATADATNDRIDIIQAKVSREESDATTIYSWDDSSKTGMASTAYITYSTELSVEAKSGTAGAEAPPTPDTGYIKIAEIRVPAGATSLSQTSNIFGLYEQSSWISNPAPINHNKNLDDLRTDLDQLREDFENYKQDFATFSVSDNTTKKSTYHPKPTNPILATDAIGYTEANPFIIDLENDGRVRYGHEFVKPKQLFSKNLEYYSGSGVPKPAIYFTEDERVKFVGDWRQNEDTGYYETYTSGDTCYVTFYGTGLLAYVSAANSTDSLQIKIDSQAVTSYDLNYTNSDQSEASLIKLAENLAEGIHTVKVYLNETAKLGIIGFIVVNPAGSTIAVNPGTHYILDTQIAITSTTNITVPTYSENGRRDVVFVDKDTSSIQLGAGTTVKTTASYGSSANHNREEFAFFLSSLDFFDVLSFGDDWTGISGSSDFTYGDNQKTYIESLSTSSASSFFEVRFFGTGLDIDISISSGLANIYIDGTDQGAVTVPTGSRQSIKVCSNLEYGSHVLRVQNFSSSVVVQFWGAFVYRPKSADNYYSDKLGINAINLVKEDTFRWHHLSKISLLNGSTWSEGSSENCWANKYIRSTNLTGSQTLEFYFVGERVGIYGTKGTSYGIFNITLDTVNFTGVDCYAGADSYNTKIWDSEIDGGQTLSYGIHKITITTTASKNGSSSDYILNLGHIRVEQPKAFVDYSNNYFNCATEQNLKQGVAQSFEEISITREIDRIQNKKEHNVFDSRLDILEDITYSEKIAIIDSNKGFWGDLYWVSTTQVIINPKAINGFNFIGQRFNDGTYLFSETNITVNLSDELSGVGAVNNAWYWICGYKKTDGTLGYAPVWMPKTTINAANPTTSLSLATVSSLDIGLVFTEDAHFVLWEDNDEFETPIFYQNGAFSAGNYVPSKDLSIASRTATTLTLSQSLDKTDFVSGAIVYQVDNFQPIDYSTGVISTSIDTAWSDTGLRFLLDGSAAILDFSCDGKNIFFQAPSSAWVGYTLTTNAVALIAYAPPDAKKIHINTALTNGDDAQHRLYYTTNLSRYVAVPIGVSSFDFFISIPVRHGISVIVRTSRLHGFEI